MVRGKHRLEFVHLLKNFSEKFLDFILRVTGIWPWASHSRHCSLSLLYLKHKGIIIIPSSEALCGGSTQIIPFPVAETTDTRVSRMTLLQILSNRSCSHVRLFLALLSHPCRQPVMKSVSYKLRVWAGIPSDVTYQVQDLEQASEYLFHFLIWKTNATIVFTSQLSWRVNEIKGFRKVPGWESMLKIISYYYYYYSFILSHIVFLEQQQKPVLTNIWIMAAY